MDKRLLDSLWNHYWVNTLSSSSLLTNAEYTTGQINDLAAKLESWEGGSSGGRGGRATTKNFSPYILTTNNLCKYVSALQVVMG